MNPQIIKVKKDNKKRKNKYTILFNCVKCQKEEQVLITCDLDVDIREVLDLIEKEELCSCCSRNKTIVENNQEFVKQRMIQYGLAHLFEKPKVIHISDIPPIRNPIQFISETSEWENNL